VELTIAIGLGAWVILMGIAATARVFKDYSDKK